MLILPCIRNPVNLASCLTAVPFYFRNRICQQNVFLRIGDQRLDLALFLIPVAFQIHIVFQQVDSFLFRLLEFPLLCTGKCLNRF